jgi:hypothetical protein
MLQHLPPRIAFRDHSVDPSKTNQNPPSKLLEANRKAPNNPTQAFLMKNVQRDQASRRLVLTGLRRQPIR